MLTGAIIAGGRGERLGGVDKALLTVSGRSLLQRVIERLRPQVQKLVLVANAPAETYASFGLPVLADQWPDRRGPLAGVHAALQSCASGDVLCVPVDAVWLPPDLAARLQAARQRDGQPAACVHDGAGLQPVCCLLPAAWAVSAQEALAAGRLALHRWLQEQGVALADFSDWPRWGWSLNTAEELQAAQAHLAAAA